MKTGFVCGIVPTLLVCLAAVGCQQETERPDRDAMTPAEYFNETQAGTNTTYGRVVPGSGEDAGRNRIRFRTEDGSTWEVTARPAGEGYDYRGQRRVEESPDSDQASDRAEPSNRSTGSR